jgi:hypothetical protein
MTSDQRARLAMWRALDQARRRLQAACPDPEEPAATAAPKVIEALRGMGAAAWIELDERSGWRDFGPWFSMVRQTRNSPVFGPQLIRAVNVAARRAAPAEAR